MTDWEKVIKGLEEVQHYIWFKNLPAHTLKAKLVIDDAIALLKAQEARHMNHCKYCTYYEPEWAYCFKYGNHVLDDDGCEKFKQKEG